MCKKSETIIFVQKTKTRRIIKNIIFFLLIPLLAFFYAHNHQGRYDFLLASNYLSMENIYLIVPEYDFLEFIVKFDNNANCNFEHILKSSSIILEDMMKNRKYYPSKKTQRYESSDNMIWLIYIFEGGKNNESHILPAGEYLVSFCDETKNGLTEVPSDCKSRSAE